MILYINNEHCSSVEQLKGYFTGDLTSDSEIYADLLDYGRYGDIATWLREMGESEMASRVESISGNLGDSAFFVQLKAAIVGMEIKTDEILKPSFDQCFSFEGMKCDMKDNEAIVTVSLKILMCVNEKYELRVSSDWGTRGEMVNPCNYSKGKIATIDFAFRKRAGKDIGEITVKADEKKLSSDSSQTRANSEVFTVKNVKFNMILVNGGSFTMGNWPDTHQVTLSDYMCGETPVTDELWRAVMEYDYRTPLYESVITNFHDILKSNFPDIYHEKNNEKNNDRRPKNWINWDDCKVFIEKLNKITNRQFRLLTEAEWEFAARGGVSTKGFEYSGSNDINDVAWYKGNSNHRRHKVKGKKPNELGIYDMLGNVWEWCNDWYSSCRYQEYSSYNPQGPINGKSKILRGGAYDSAYSECEVHSFSNHRRNVRAENIGFRLALSMK